MKETGSGSELGSNKFYPEWEVEAKNFKGEEAEANSEARMAVRYGTVRYCTP